jgi:hypothetical protein
MITVVNYPTGKSDLIFEFGSRFKITNVRTSVVERLSIDTICSRIDYLIEFNAAQVVRSINTTGRRMLALNVFSYKAHARRDWGLPRLALFIVEHQDELIDMLPPPGMPSYKQISQIAYDLILWAKQQQP